MLICWLILNFHAKLSLIFIYLLLSEFSAEMIYGLELVRFYASSKTKLFMCWCSRKLASWHAHKGQQHLP